MSLSFTEHAWKARVNAPKEYQELLDNYEFDVIIGANGKSKSLNGMCYIRIGITAGEKIV